ncbi:hypothetical protein RFI_22421, partial [Reticulomyxa filosa]
LCEKDVEMIMNKNTNNVYLRCLPQNFTEKDLTELCSPFGQLTCTRVRENGVAFVRFRQPENAQQAIRELNGKLISGSQRPLLAKLANSFNTILKKQHIANVCKRDPFQPKIGFRARSMDEADDNSSVRMIEDEGMTAVLLEAAKHQMHGQSGHDNNLSDVMTDDMWNTFPGHNRRKEHNYNHNHNHNHSHNHNHVQQRSNFHELIDSNAGMADSAIPTTGTGITSTPGSMGGSNRNGNAFMGRRRGRKNYRLNNSHYANPNNGMERNKSIHSNSNNRSKYPQQHFNNTVNGHPIGNDFHHNISTSLNLGNVGMPNHPHLINNSDLFQSSQTYGMMDPAMYAYQASMGYPYYDFTVGNTTTSDINANTTAVPSTETTSNTPNASYYGSSSVGAPYPYLSNNIQGVPLDLINGSYNMPQPSTGKTTDFASYMQLASNIHMDNPLEEVMDTQRDTLPLQTQASESLTPSNHPLSLDNSSLLFVNQKELTSLKTSQPKLNLMNSQDTFWLLREKDKKTTTDSVLKDSIRSGSQTMTTTSNGTTEPIQSIGVTVPKFGMPNHPLFFSPGGGSEYSSVISTGSTSFANIAPSTLSTNKVPNMAPPNTGNKTQRYLSPGSQQVLDLQTQLPSSPGQVGMHSNNGIALGFNQNGNSIKLFDPMVINQTHANNKNVDDVDRTLTASLETLYISDTNSTVINNIDPKIGDKVFASVFKYYPNNTAKITGQLLKRYNMDACLKMLENASEFKAKIDQIASVT